MNTEQQKVHNKMKEYGWNYWSNQNITLHMVEELGEIAKITNSEKTPKATDDINLEGEVGDLYYSLICLANNNNINLSEALLKIMLKHAVRDKDRF